MRKRAVRVWILATVTLAPAIVTSCLDFSSLSSSDSDAAVDGSVADSPIAVNDAATLPDSSFDAGSEAGFCASNPGHTLCDDFDTPDFLSDWNSATVLTPGSKVSQDPLLFVTPPYSLNATTAYIDASTSAWVVARYQQIPGRIAISFDLNIATAGDTAVALTELLLPNGYAYAIRLQAPAPLYLTIQQVVPPTTDGGPTRYLGVASVNFMVQTGQWYHVAVELPISGADAGNVTASFNGAAAISVAPPVQPTFADGGITLQAGVANDSAPPFSAWSIRLDDYVFDLK
jgi:hypothetical protein